MCLSATTLLAISTGFSVVSALAMGQQQADQAEWQAEQAAADAKAEREAADIRADKLRKAGKAQQSQARAALAASGVETGAGTPVKIDQEIMRDAEADAQQELLSGKYGAARLNSESAGLKLAADNARTKSYLRAGGSLLQGGSQISKGWQPSKLNTMSHNPDEWY